jgi:hypothetical protein
MSDIARSFASIGAGVLGFAVGGPLGFSIATMLFNYVLPAQQPGAQGGKRNHEPEKNTAVDTAIFQVFGHAERTGGECIRCYADKFGRRTGIVVKRKKKEAEGGSGGAPDAPEQIVEKQFLSASFALCAGPTRVERFAEVNDKDGEVVKWQRGIENQFRHKWANGTHYEVNDTVRLDGKIYLCLEEHDASAANKPDKGPDWSSYWANMGEHDEVIEFTPVYGAVSGDEVGVISEKLRLYWGSEEQPVDTAEEEWYEEGVSADRGITKAVFSQYGPLDLGTTFRWWLVNDLTNRREIITARLVRCGIPESRIDLRSIPEDLESYGWYVERIEPGRNLAESVAALSNHDLHFMATERGMVFTDISRANPTVVVVPDEMRNAFANNEGTATIPGGEETQIQSAENKPREIKVSFKNRNRNNKDDSAQALWTAANGEPQSVSMNSTDDYNTFKTFAEIMMRELQMIEGTTEESLMPAMCEVAPGTVLDVSHPTDIEPNGRRLLRVVAQKKMPEGILQCTCAPYDPSAYDAVPDVVEVIEPTPAPAAVGTPELIFLDGVSLTDEMAEQPTALVGARVENGREFAVSLLLLDNTTSGKPIELADAAVCGVLDGTYVYTDNDLYAFDYDTTLRIVMDEGQVLGSCTEADVMDKGYNILWIGDSAGGGTYVGYTTATAIDPTNFDITGLMPGVAGSDSIRSVADGARVVQITDETGAMAGGLTSVEMKRRALMGGNKYELRVRQNEQKQSSGTVTYAANNMKVLAVSPHITRGTDELGDGMVLKFFARSRFPESSLNYYDAGLPILQSDPLAYLVELLDGATVLDARLVTSTDSEFTVEYSDAQLTAIYGGPAPDPVVGRITGGNDWGAGFVRQFSV